MSEEHRIFAGDRRAGGGTANTFETHREIAMSKLAHAMSINSKTVLTHVIEFSLFGGIVTAMAAGVIRLH